MPEVLTHQECRAAAQPSLPVRACIDGKFAAPPSGRTAIRPPAQSAVLSGRMNTLNPKRPGQVGRIYGSVLPV